MDNACNDNAAPAGRMVPIVGQVGPDGSVTITVPDWRPRPVTGLAEVGAAWPNDPREA